MSRRHEKSRDKDRCACSQDVCDGKDVSGGLQRGAHSADEQVVHEVVKTRRSHDMQRRVTFRQGSLTCGVKEKLALSSDDLGES